MKTKMLKMVLAASVLIPALAFAAPSARIAKGSADPAWSVRPTVRTDTGIDTGLPPTLLVAGWCTATAGCTSTGAWKDTSAYSSMVFSINCQGSATVIIESSSSVYSIPTGVGITTHTYYGNTVPTLLTDVGAWTRVRITTNSCVDCNGGPSGAGTLYVNSIFRQ